MTAKLKIPDAAYVIGTTPLAIRKWLEKSKIAWLAGARPEKGMAAEFGTLDLLRMRLVVVLLEYGVTLDEASRLVYSTWQSYFPPDPANPDDEELTVAAILDVFSSVFDRLIFARVKGQEWSITVTDRPKDSIPYAALVITPHNLFSEVLDRAKALQNSARLGGMTMSPRPATFRQADLVRVLKAAEAAGMRIERVEIDAATGRIVITPTRITKPSTEDGEHNEWDEVLK